MAYRLAVDLDDVARLLRSTSQWPRRCRVRYLFPTSQPRSDSRPPPHAGARETETLLEAAGYTEIRTETLDLEPPVVCIHASNPAAAT